MNAETLVYPPAMGKIIFCGMEEVIGKGGVDAVLRPLLGDEDLQEGSPLPARALPFQSVSRLLASLEQTYGPRGGRGVALRAGRACFKYGLKEYGSLMGVTEMAFRLLPLRTKLRVGAKYLADLFNHHTSQKVRLEETETKIFWHIERCPLCWERKADEPICHLAVGVLQEALYWVSGGKVFNVAETTCIAQGAAACTIEIEKTPF